MPGQVMNMFTLEPEPVRGRPIRIDARIQRVVAPNAGAMTYHGTNSYVVATDQGAVVIDPGPDDAAHLDLLADAAGGAVAMILLTHDHRDHAAGVAGLVRRTGAPVASARAVGAQPLGHAVARQLADGEVVAGLEVIATPGHAPDHLCFRLNETIFTGDHVLGWSPTSVLAPEGCAGAYRDSLARLAGVRSRLFLPGHGPQVRNTRRFVEFLMSRADDREREIRALIAERPAGTDDIVGSLYASLGPETRSVALRTLEAQLCQLERSGRIIRDGAKWRNLQ